MLWRNEKMAISINTVERSARYVMGAVCLLGVLVWAAFKLGWITTAPSYKNDAWYLVGGNSDFVITSEYADETACRRNENSSAICRSGKVLLEQERRSPSEHR
jgi:hypothetical protein